MANYCVSLRDDKNAAFCISSPSLAVAGEHGKRHARQAHKPKAVSDWLNPHTLGTMPHLVSWRENLDWFTGQIERTISEYITT